jgi:hypothetical protein
MHKYIPRVLRLIVLITLFALATPVIVATALVMVNGMIVGLADFITTVAFEGTVEFAFEGELDTLAHGLMALAFTVGAALAIPKVVFCFVVGVVAATATWCAMEMIRLRKAAADEAPADEAAADEAAGGNATAPADLDEALDGTLEGLVPVSMTKEEDDLLRVIVTPTVLLPPRP